MQKKLHVTRFTVALKTSFLTVASSRRTCLAVLLGPDCMKSFNKRLLLRFRLHDTITQFLLLATVARRPHFYRVIGNIGLDENVPGVRGPLF